MINVGLDSLESPYTCSLCEKVFPPPPVWSSQFQCLRRKSSSWKKVRSWGGGTSLQTGAHFPPRLKNARPLKASEVKKTGHFMGNKVRSKLEKTIIPAEEKC